MDQQKTNVDFDALKRLNEPSVDTGNATAGGAATLTDTAKEWEVNQWVGQVVEITEGTAKGEFRNIISNTATVLTVAPAWTVAPDNTSWYRIGLAAGGGGGGGPVVDSGIATGGAAASLTDALKNWDVNALEGKVIKITSGASDGDYRKIISNTATIITVANAFTAVIVAGVTYSVLEDVSLAADVRRSATSNLVPLAKQMDEGIVTTAGVGVLTVTDVNKNLSLNCYTGYEIRVVAGTGAGSVRRIVSNTAGAGTVYTVDAVLTTGTDSKYIIYALPLTGAGGVPAANLVQVNGTAQTAYDWTGLLRAVPKDEGLVTVLAVGATLTDTLKFWDVNIWVGKYVRVVSGTGAGQVRRIVSNTLNVLTVANAWATQPTTDSRYVISELPLTDATGRLQVDASMSLFIEGSATGGAPGVLTDAGANWDVNALVNHLLVITAGTGAGLVSRILSNTATGITFDDAGVTPDATSVYKVVPWNREILTDPFGNELHPATELDAGIATAGAAGVLTDGFKNWDVNIWANQLIAITAGTGVGTVSKILSNTATAITFADAGVIPGATSVYKVISNINNQAVAFTHNQVAIPVSGGGAVVIAAANPNRKRLTISVNANSSRIYIGGAGVTNANGFNMEPGAVMVFDDMTAAVYGLNNDAVSATAVNYIEETY